MSDTMVIAERQPHIEGNTFVRQFRPDCSFPRRIKWDEGFGCYMAEIMSGPLAGNYDPEPVTELEALISRGRLVSAI